MQRVGIIGATGKMGSLAARSVDDADDLMLAVQVSPTRPAELGDAGWAPSIDDLVAADVDVVVDFTRPDVAAATLHWSVEHGVDAVIGTSGLADGVLEAAGSRAREAGVRILVVPNFSVGAVLLQRLAVQAAPYFDAVEVVELHHDQKRDAPSGTSIATARALAAARAERGLADLADPTTTTTLDGSRGASGPGGVRVHSVRLPGLLAHQEVLFGSPGEGLVLRHDTYDRSSFMSGVLLAVRRIATIDVGLEVGLEAVLER